MTTQWISSFLQNLITHTHTHTQTLRHSIQTPPAPCFKWDKLLTKDPLIQQPAGQADLFSEINTTASPAQNNQHLLMPNLTVGRLVQSAGQCFSTEHTHSELFPNMPCDDIKHLPVPVYNHIKGSVPFTVYCGYKKRKQNGMSAASLPVSSPLLFSPPGSR